MFSILVLVLEVLWGLRPARRMSSSVFWHTPLQTKLCCTVKVWGSKGCPCPESKLIMCSAAFRRQNTLQVKGIGPAGTKTNLAF